MLNHKKKKSPKERGKDFILWAGLVLLMVSGLGYALSSNDIDLVCSQNNMTLFRYNGQWGCGDLTGTVITNYITNTTFIQTNHSIHATNATLAESVIGGIYNATYNAIVNGSNVTFEKDVIVNGILYGGSPVKIDGINITNNLFTQKDNLNSSLRFTLLNENSGSNATTVVSAVNDVGGSMSFGVASSKFMMGLKQAYNITALFSKSRGATFFANFFNYPFVWKINFGDDGDVDNLVEVMRLNQTGLIVNGSVISDNTFFPQYIFPHTNQTISVVGSGVWTNITFIQEVTAIKLGVQHSHTSSFSYVFNITEDGIYDIDFDFDAIDTSPSASDIDVAGRVMFINGTEIVGSVFESDITKQNIETEISHEFLAELLRGDQLVFQFTADDADVDISTHGTFGVHPESATAVIEKVYNL